MQLLVLDVRKLVKSNTTEHTFELCSFIITILYSYLIESAVFPETREGRIQGYMTTGEAS